MNFDDDFWKPIDKEILRNRRVLAVQMYHTMTKGNTITESRDIVYARQKTLIEKGLLAFKHKPQLGDFRLTVTDKGRDFLEDKFIDVDGYKEIPKELDTHDSLWKDYV